MNPKDALEIASAVIVSLGGGGGIVFGLSNYLGKVWADRGLERQKHELNQLSIAFQSQLDLATRRVQVELDALGLIHKLRTEEEFTRLAELWKRLAELRNSFMLIAPRGLTRTFADPEVQRKWEEKNRQEFDVHLNSAQEYLSLEALFIPKDICDSAQEALLDAASEQHTYLMFEPYLRPGTEVSDIDRHMRKQYFEARNQDLESFSRHIGQLEHLMRTHIAGRSIAMCAEPSVAANATTA